MTGSMLKYTANTATIHLQFWDCYASILQVPWSAHEMKEARNCWATGFVIAVAAHIINMKQDKRSHLSRPDFTEIWFNSNLRSICTYSYHCFSMVDLSIPVCKQIPEGKSHEKSHSTTIFPWFFHWYIIVADAAWFPPRVFHQTAQVPSERRG